MQSHVRAVAELSESLRLQRRDGGVHLTALGRGDITAFLNRLSFLHANETISAYQRLQWCRFLRKMIARMRALGLTRKGEALHGLPDDFALGSADMPDEPEDCEAERDLPIEVMRHLCEHLDLLEEIAVRELRVATELVIDTGRRPDEICQLPLQCLDRDGDEKPVLVWSDFKNNKIDRRLPITEGTAALITKQQRVRHRYPNESQRELVLLPALTRNPHGNRTIALGWLTSRHRRWVDLLPDVTVPTKVNAPNGTVATEMLPSTRARSFSTPTGIPIASGMPTPGFRSMSCGN